MLNLQVLEPFSGKPSENVKHWLRTVELVAVARSLTEVQKVCLACSQLLGSAASWLDAQPQDILQTWSVFSSAMRKNFFDEVDADCLVDALLSATQHQQERALDYLQRIQYLAKALAEQGEPVPDGLLLKVFVNGLPPPIKQKVKETRPTSLEGAASDADYYAEYYDLPKQMPEYEPQSIQISVQKGISRADPRRMNQHQPLMMPECQPRRYDYVQRYPRYSQAQFSRLHEAIDAVYHSFVNPPAVEFAAYEPQNPDHRALDCHAETDKEEYVPAEHEDQDSDAECEGHWNDDSSVDDHELLESAAESEDCSAARTPVLPFATRVAGDNTDAESEDHMAGLYMCDAAPEIGVGQAGCGVPAASGAEFHDAALQHAALVAAEVLPIGASHQACVVLNAPSNHHFEHSLLPDPGADLFALDPKLVDPCILSMGTKERPVSSEGVIRALQHHASAHINFAPAEGHKSSMMLAKPSSEKCAEKHLSCEMALEFAHHKLICRPLQDAFRAKPAKISHASFNHPFPFCTAVTGLSGRSVEVQCHEKNGPSAQGFIQLFTSSQLQMQVAQSCFPGHIQVILALLYLCCMMIVFVTECLQNMPVVHKIWPFALSSTHLISIPICSIWPCFLIMVVLSGVG